VSIIHDEYSLPYVKQFVPHNRANYTSSSPPPPSSYVHVEFPHLFLHGASINKPLISFKDFYGKVMARVSLSVEEDEGRTRREETHRRQTRLKDTIPE